MRLLTYIIVSAFRLMGLVALACLLIFPVFKGQWLGFVPILFGAGLIVVGIKVRHHVEKLLEGRVFLAVLIVPLMIQFVLIMVLQPEPRQDSYNVVQEAATWAEENTWSEKTYYPPAQTFYYGVFFRMFGAGDRVAQLSNLPLTFLCIVTMMMFAGHLSPGRRKLAVACFAFYPTFLSFILTTPYYYYLYTLFILLVCYGWQVSATTEGRDNPMGTGIAAGFGALTKPVLLLAPLQALLIWICLIRGRKRWIGLAVFCLSFVLVLTPWTNRNMK
ncbi:MAG: hypothetical protein AAF492_19215, partial [Verrucomicrobiota bacterium]